MRKKGVTKAAAAFLILIMTISGCSESQKSGTIKVGIRGNIAGFGYKNPISGTYSGMEVDLARMLAKSMGYSSVELVEVTVDSREKALENGDVDFIAADFTITDERKEKFDFSPAYYHDNVKIMVENSTGFTKLRNLSGKRIGVRSGSTAALVCAQTMEKADIIPAFDHDSFEAETFKGGVTFVCMDDYDMLDAALEEGTVDGLCSDFSILNGHLNDDRSLIDENLMEQQIGICTIKGSRLSGQIAESIEKWTKDGTLDELISKWDLK